MTFLIIASWAHFAAHWPGLVPRSKHGAISSRTHFAAVSFASCCTLLAKSLVTEFESIEFKGINWFTILTSRQSEISSFCTWSKAKAPLPPPLPLSCIHFWNSCTNGALAFNAQLIATSEINGAIVELIQVAIVSISSKVCSNAFIVFFVDVNFA